MTTSETGAFRFDRLSAACYRITIAVEGYASRTMHLGCLTPDTRLDCRIRIAAASQVTGRVVDHDGKPLAGVTVSPLTLRATDLTLYLCHDLQPAVTDDEGRFTLARLPTGYAELKLKRPGAQLFGDTTRLINVPSSGVRIRLEALGRIEGVVPEELRGDGQVHIHPANGDLYGLAYTANCAEDGSFAIENVPPGEYRIGTEVRSVSGYGGDPTGIPLILVLPGETASADLAPSPGIPARP
jgi:hypothetical protein